MLRNKLSFLEAVWMFFAYYTATHFNWWLLLIAIALCPKWKDIRDWADLELEWRKSREQGEIERMEEEVMDEKEGN